MLYLVKLPFCIIILPKKIYISETIKKFLSEPYYYSNNIKYSNKKNRTKLKLLKLFKYKEAKLS